MTQRMVPASGPMLLLGYGVSRGLSLDTLCGLIDYAPHQLADPSRMVPFETSLSLWHALIKSLPDENIGVGLGSFARLEHAGMLCPMPALGAASSLTYQPQVEGSEPLFPAGTIVVTSFFGGGLYTLPGFR
jgi:Arabinose-binding domain of AraC transcription regulator, N-term